MDTMGDPLSRRCLHWNEDELELLRGAIIENENGSHQAIKDCAYILGRQVEAVAKKAQYLRRDDRKLAAVERFMPTKPALIYMPEAKLDPIPPRQAKPIPYVSSFIRKLTPQELMCGRVSRRTVAA